MKFLRVNLSIFLPKNALFVSLKFSTNRIPAIVTEKKKIMKVLNVAEKNDAAKNIAALLGRGNCRRRDGLSVYNKIYEFNMRLFNQDCQMIMTSVSGHLLNWEFVGTCRKWHGCHPLTLFDAPLVKECEQDSAFKIKRTLEKEIKNCSALIIWTDCDREGENIGFEIINVCKAVKQNIRIYRAKFSEITQASIQRAIQTLGEPNKAVSDAVDVRSELDLRIGAAFTRFQTLRLQKVFPRTLADMLISYGSCQFPTLGFVVERFLAIERFQSEPYWKIRVSDNRDDINVEFRWERNRLFEKMPCQVILDICLENSQATVQKVVGKPKSKWRPLPLDTIELEKQGSRKLRLNAKETMKTAEKLYTQGFISYPRTETNIFPKELNLTNLVQQQTNNDTWGEFAQRVLNEGISPRQGKKSDQAHPPIHPTKLATGLQGNEAKVYEFVVRHFLACVSKNAEGHETTVDIDIAGEKFVASGLQIIAKNYLDVYIYEKWNSKEIHLYQQGQIFTPTAIEMLEEKTSPPNLLTEADLIALMDKHGIGTDATHAEHIDTIKSREYVGLRDGTHFIPGKLGIGLVMGYDNMGFAMSKPNLRAELENDLKAICDGTKNPEDVLKTQIDKYREVFKNALDRASMIDVALAQYLDETPLEAENIESTMPMDAPTVLKCPKCGSNMVVKTRKNGIGKYISCQSYPNCNNAIWLPQDIKDVEVLEERCSRCPNDNRKIKVTVKPGAFPIPGLTYTTCIGGCDSNFNEMMGIREENVRGIRGNDSGYDTSRSTILTAPSSGGSSMNRDYNNAGSRGGRVSGSQARGTISHTSNRTTSQNSRRPGDSEPTGENGSSSSGRKRPTSGTTQGTQRPPSFKRQATETGTIAVGNRENEYPSWGLIDDDTVILCDCHERATKLTVSKDGPNKGRKFFKCSKPRENQCNFFLWAEDSDEQQRPNDSRANQSYAQTSTTNFNPRRPSPTRPNPSNVNQTSTTNFNPRRPSPTRPNPSNSSSAAQAPTCNCGQPAVQRTVRKEGPNKGKQFWACPQGPGSPCNFFSWIETTSNVQNNDSGHSDWNDSSQYGGASFRRGRGGHGQTRGNSRSREGGRSRKCGICGVEGHTRRTCTQNSMD